MKLKDKIEKFDKYSPVVKRVADATAIICVIVCAVCVISLSMTIDQVQEIMTQHKNNRGDLDNIEAMMLEIQSIYETEYIGEDVDPAKLEDAALAGFTLGYEDEYAVYRSPDESAEAANDLNEKLMGIGVEMVYEGEEGLYLIQVYRNSPAETAGIQAGDRIISVGDTHVDDIPYEDFLELFKGEEGTQVTIGYIRDGKEYSTEVIRGDVKTESVRGQILEGNVGYIKIDKFTEHTNEEFKEYVNSYQESGVDKFIFDVRNNSGGVAETVIDMLNFLLPKGLITKFEYVDDSKNQEYYSDSNEVIADMVVLANRGSASASELFAKALQDYGKAIVIGTTTYGKGTICSTFNLSNGGTLTLSTGRYTTISGEEIEDIGVTPDIEVKMKYADLRILYKLPFDEDIQFQTAYKELTGQDWE